MLPFNKPYLSGKELEYIVQAVQSDKDVVIGIAASGTTPYVIGALEECRESLGRSKPGTSRR